MVNDTISDMLTRIRNAYSVNKSDVKSPYSKLRESVLKVLKDEGYIGSYKKSEAAKNIFVLDIELKYHEGLPCIKEVKKLSKPGRRVYKKVSELPRFCNGLGVSIVSTSRGVLTDNQARAHNIGGEVLCQVF